jgi:SatD family protein
MPSQIYAVLIADVLESSSRLELRALLGKKLAAVSKRHLQRKLINLPYSVTAGDEFQTVTGNLPSIPAVILDLRSMLRPLSLRIGIGIGRVSDRIQPPVNRLSGEAFQFARRAIENVKTNSVFKFEVLTAFASRNESFNNAINLIYGLHDTLVLKIRTKQWETIQEFLDRPALEQTARRLNLDTSTVSRNLKRGYYWQLADTVKVGGSLIGNTFR